MSIRWKEEMLQSKTYIGQDLKRMEQQKPVTWFVDSPLSDGRHAKQSSHFQSSIGIERDGATAETPPYKSLKLLTRTTSESNGTATVRNLR